MKIYTRREYKNESDIIKILDNGSTICSEKGSEDLYLFGIRVRTNHWDQSFVDKTEDTSSKKIGFGK